MKIAVTGASGSYGRAAAHGLLDRIPPEQIILISRGPERLTEFAEKGCAVRHGDFDDLASMTEALAGVERMLLISTGRVGRRVPQHANAITAAAKAGVGHIVYTSFIGISDANPALVIRDHGPTEELLRKSGMAWTALRDSQYADAMTDAAAPNALRAGVWLGCTGEGRIAFVTRADCVASAVEVLTGEGHHNKVYNITGPERLRFKDITAIVGEILGVDLPYQDISPDEMYRMFDALGIPRESHDDHIVGGFPWCSEDMVSFEIAIRDGHFDIISNDVETLTGRRPEDFRHFAERNKAALRAALNSKKD